MKQTITLVFESGKKIELTEEEYKELEKKFTKTKVVTVPLRNPDYYNYRYLPQYWLTTSSIKPPKPEGPPNEVVKEEIFGK